MKDQEAGEKAAKEIREYMLALLCTDMDVAGIFEKLEAKCHQIEQDCKKGWYW